MASKASSTRSGDARSLPAPPVPEVRGERAAWAGLHGAAFGLALAESAARLDAPMLVLVPDTLAANRLVQELTFFGGVPVLVLPDWETLPYDHFSPYQDIVSERLLVLARLPSLGRGILVVPVATAMHRLPPREYVSAHAFDLAVGARLDVDALRQQLSAAGYRCVSQVLEHGDYSVRGSLLDVFPMGSAVPLRIDLLDETIDSIRTFDTESQRSVDRVASIRILPAREFPLTEAAIAQFRARWRSHFGSRSASAPIYLDVSQGLAPAGIEYYLPLFFDHTDTLFDYLPPATLVVVDAGVDAAMHRFQDDIRERYEQGRHDVERPLLEPDVPFLRVDDVSAGVAQMRAVMRGADAGESVFEFDTRPPARLPVDARAEAPLALVQDFLATHPGRVLFVAESGGRRETMLELFRGAGQPLATVPDWSSFLAGSERVGLAVAPLQEGLDLRSPPITIVTEAQLFGERAAQARRARRSARDPESIIRDLRELSPGTPVVHELHGVGRYRGLVTLEVDGIAGEFILLEYADADRLYVPVGSLHLIGRFSGIDPDHAPLHKLGSGQWQKARARAAERIRDVAAELLEIHARRAAREGFPVVVERDAYRAFCQGFPFEETRDQELAINAVLGDLASGRPMDRLICGDVGFGKTEVAMRAAWAVAAAGKQVAVLVPTTLLAQQHHQNFRDRFADWPVRVEQLSRFRARKEQDAVVQGLEAGTVDIVIGTHKLLQSGITFKRLGLVIIDEEHRFGVRQKEFLKSLRADVHILTLTATPIPRTLSMALSGTRDLSIIATPPARRLSIKTFVREWNDALLREALLRELARGGQVYFVHNEVESIEGTARTIAALVPEARVRVAHGQMRELELERVMLDFYHQRCNVLVCTTIIETGIDVPSANTLVIDRADCFGLAQLYQLRGRVGRSHHRAYAYLLVPSRRALSGDAARRLEAIEALEELGFGFTLATHDLEIRGAGEILGDEQSGHIQEIGFALYSELLERAVADLRAGRQPELDRPLDHGCEVDLRAPALIPADWLPDVHTRLISYKRIASARSEEDLADLREEMVDRFGALPEQVRTLFAVTALKLRAMPLGVRKIELGDAGGRLLFQAKPAIDPLAVITLVQKQPQRYRLDGKDRLRVILPTENVDARVEFLQRLLDTLTVRRAA